MVTFINQKGEKRELNRKEFLRLMKILKKRAKLNKREKIINEMMTHWN